MPTPSTLDSLIRSTIAELIESAPQPPALPEIELGSTMQVRNLSGGRKSPLRRFRLPILAAGIALVAAAVMALSFATLLTSTTSGPQQTRSSAGVIAHRVLISEATLAAAEPPDVPGPGQWLYVQTTSGSITSSGSNTAIWNYYIHIFSQQWTEPSGANASSAFVTGQPQFITKVDLATWQAAGSPPIEIGGGGPPPAVFYDVTNLPTDPTHMAAYFATQTQIPGASSSNPGDQFDVAVGFLSHGASSAQRAALFQYMATLPGVKSLGWTQALGNGDTGETLAVPGTMGREIEAVIQLRTTQLIEERVVVADPSQLGAGLYPSEMRAGEALSYTDFTHAGIATSSSSPSEYAPVAPTPWLPDTPRTPLSTVAY